MPIVFFQCFVFVGSFPRFPIETILFYFVSGNIADILGILMYVDYLPILEGQIKLNSYVVLTLFFVTLKITIYGNATSVKVIFLIGITTREISELYVVVDYIPSFFFDCFFGSFLVTIVAISYKTQVSLFVYDVNVSVFVLFLTKFKPIISSLPIHSIKRMFQFLFLVPR